jgi:hypothetical protein
MNVYLVNSGASLPESWRLILLFPYPVSLNDPAEPTGFAPSSLAAPPNLSAKMYAANCTLYRAKMEDPL